MCRFLLVVVLLFLNCLLHTEAIKCHMFPKSDAGEIQIDCPSTDFCSEVLVLAGQGKLISRTLNCGRPRCSKDAEEFYEHNGTLGDADVVIYTMLVKCCSGDLCNSTKS